MQLKGAPTCSELQSYKNAHVALPAVQHASLFVPHNAQKHPVLSLCLQGCLEMLV